MYHQYVILTSIYFKLLFAFMYMYTLGPEIQLKQTLKINYKMTCMQSIDIQFYTTNYE